MVFIYPSGNSDHKQDHSYKRKRRNRFWVYAIENFISSFSFKQIFAFVFLIIFRQIRQFVEGVQFEGIHEFLGDLV